LSFCDRSGDGIGDLDGIRAHLDHVARLGVDAVWLSPIYQSPLADFGYDVADYEDVDPVFGDLQTFDDLVRAAHNRGLKVILDWVPNHTSDVHPWFIESRSRRDHPKRDWFIWRDSPSQRSGPQASDRPGEPPNNWRAAFPGVGGHDFPPAWTWDEGSKQWYLHLFLDRQPDLNWANPEVRRAMAGVLRFWLDRSVDGFRVDVIHALAKPPGLPDLPPERAAIPYCAFIDDPAVHPWIAEVRRLIDETPPPARVLIGEIVLPTVAQIVPYYGTPGQPELHLAFNFHPLRAPWDPTAWRRQIDDVAALLGPAGAWPTWVLSNHDNPRHRTRYGTEPRARAAAVLLLTLPGTPFLYAGEELGLADADVALERRVDPGGRDGCRAPIPWTADPDHGWAADPWLPWPPESDRGRTASEQQTDPESMLSLYQRIIGARRRSPALQIGGFEWLGSTEGVLAYQRRRGDDTRIVAVNFMTEQGEANLPPGRWAGEVGTAQAGRYATVEGCVTLRPDEAVILRHA
jgi:alpha-glucosidase